MSVQEQLGDKGEKTVRLTRFFFSGIIKYIFSVLHYIHFVVYACSVFIHVHGVGKGH